VKSAFLSKAATRMSSPNNAYRVIIVIAYHINRYLVYDTVGNPIKEVNYGLVLVLFLSLGYLILTKIYPKQQLRVFLRLWGSINISHINLNLLNKYKMIAAEAFVDLPIAELGLMLGEKKIRVTYNIYFKDFPPFEV